MGPQPTVFEAGEAASLMRWWRDAGVDALIDEEPHNWLGSAAASPKPAEPEAPQSETLPQTLDTFTDWLMTADLPDAGPSRRRVRPSGDPASGLMILTDMPELADTDSGMLIAGELSAMFERMLALLGRDRDTIYLASVCPGRPPSGRLTETALDRLSEIARHHIRLAAPKQLWLMGKAASRAILGTDEIAAAGKLHEINLDGTTMAAIATAHPRLLNGSADLKKRAWADMQRLIAGSTE